MKSTRNLYDILDSNHVIDHIGSIQFNYNSLTCISSLVDDCIKALITASSSDSLESLIPTGIKCHNLFMSYSPNSSLFLPK